MEGIKTCYLQQLWPFPSLYRNVPRGEIKAKAAELFRNANKFKMSPKLQEANKNLEDLVFENEAQVL